ncbi:Putative Flp pilus-assembly TadE/G-like [Mariprofundus ferrinatatus]|uniref:Flp pilus-assembly TadE/G-like n=1 Tax=Mariprofundus ferrinatatus TaxID=1921087 RepID=A0A2K8L9Z9_9PROT|nr:pilus assembly protein TadG-related protein [Mariprofundus ferrinatatus]ATX81774.1 Putative Flp pilus-assembly TadE/G-like [Mariprofundus ferrinatatus]
MCMQSRKERGAILIMTLVYSVVLIGIAALALDVGRLLLLHSEMSNAADAAALAAAAELDGKDDARARARTAARELLSHTGRFAKKQDLLNNAALPDSAFTFYCAIGSEFDLDSSAACSDSNEDHPYYDAATDAEAHYVKVTLADDGGTDDYYVIDLLFFPVINLITNDDTILASAHAEATAGRNNLICNYPPLMICDPFEGEGGLKNNLTRGQQIRLKAQGPNTSWAPGDFGFLQPTAGPGADNLKEAIADEGIQGCTPRIVTTNPGEVVSTTDPFNSRFDEGGKKNEYPPAPNVIDYPNDQTWVSYDNCKDDSKCRIGNNDWSRLDYWNEFHGGTPPTTLDFDDEDGIPFNDATRYDFYRWEVLNDELPCSEGYAFFKDQKGNLSGDTLSCSGNPSASFDKKDYVATEVLNKGSWVTEYFTSPGHGPIVEGIPSNKDDDLLNRRVLYIATLSCDALGMNGKTTNIPVNSPDGFAKIFLIKHSLGPSYADLDGEYQGWSDTTESTQHVDLQLYE